MTEGSIQRTANNRAWLRRDGLIALAALLAVTGMLLYVRMTQGVWGFPLDDGWIYQTYARNLARTGQWAFVSGVPSTGSTSVWWTLLLAHLCSPICRYST